MKRQGTRQQVVVNWQAREPEYTARCKDHGRLSEKPRLNIEAARQDAANHRDQTGCTR